MAELTGEAFRINIVERLRAEYVALAARWLERLMALVPAPAEDIFPTDTLLDHIPELILDIADYLDSPGQRAIVANTRVLAKARELGALRYEQRASLHQIMREYRLLEAVLVSFVREEAKALQSVPGDDAIALTSQLHLAVSVLQEATVDSFVSRYADTVAEQTRRLGSFNRMVSHELRQPLGALHFAQKLLKADEALTADQRRLVDVIDRNTQRVVDLTTTLTRLAGMHISRETVHRQRVPLALVAREAARQIRDTAQERGVAIEVSENLPEADVDVGALELALVNLLSNAVKYSDPQKAERRVAIRSAEPPGDAVVIAVSDNGLGIPAERLATLFEPSSRAHAHLDGALGVTGLGLGLAIARDCARTLGGDISVESQEGVGTTFRLWFPRAGASSAVPERPSV